MNPAERAAPVSLGRTRGPRSRDMANFRFNASDGERQTYVLGPGTHRWSVHSSIEGDSNEYERLESFRSAGSGGDVAAIVRFGVEPPGSAVYRRSSAVGRHGFLHVSQLRAGTQRVRHL